MTDYTELKRLAEAAAEGQVPWWAVVPESATVNPTGSALLIGPRRQDLDRMVAFVREDAEFIAAANPAAVLALIADADQNTSAQALLAERNQLQAEVQRLEAKVASLIKERDLLARDKQDFLEDFEGAL